MKSRLTLEVDSEVRKVPSDTQFADVPTVVLSNECFNVVPPPNVLCRKSPYVSCFPKTRL